MNQNDLDTLKELRRELRDAMQLVERFHEMDEEEGVSVDETAYERAQIQLEQAVVDLTDAIDDMVDRTDGVELPNGDYVALPRAALERTRETKLPEQANQ